MENQAPQSEGKRKKCTQCMGDVDVKAKKCIHCGSDLRSWINRHPLMTLFLLVVGLVMFPFIMAGINNTTSNESTLTSQSVHEELKSEPLDKQLTQQIETISKFNGNEYRGSVEKINNELLLITFWSNLTNEAKRSEDANVQKLGKTLETKLIQLQIKEFPLMRADYGKLAGSTLWEHDVNVSVFGTGDSTIEFSGAVFAANKNIKDAQQVIRDMLKNLRFDRANYKWFDGADEYSYYTIESLKDSEIAGK